MRRTCLGIVVAAAVLIALPASARIFRTDLNRCDSSGADFVTVCWDGFPANDIPQLPLNGETSFGSTNGLASAVFTTSSFALTAFDYAQFMADNQAYFQTHNIAAPIREISVGLSRPSVPDQVNGTPFDGTETPMLRINWFFDLQLLSDFSTLFEDVVSLDKNYFGVQLIFDGQGFELNGLKAAGMAGVPGGIPYSRSIDASGNEIWNGLDQPCGRFDNSGVCIAPEPSSIALFGLGLLALVVGIRTGKPARTLAA